MSETSEKYRDLEIGGTMYIQVRSVGGGWPERPAVRVTRVPDGVIYTMREVRDPEGNPNITTDRQSIFVSFLEMDAAERINDNSVAGGSLLESVAELEAEIKKASADLVEQINGAGSGDLVNTDLVKAIVEEVEKSEFPEFTDAGIREIVEKMGLGDPSLQDQVAAWQAETFPGATTRSRIKHLEKEVGELEEAELGISRERILREAADCAILLFGIAALVGGDLLDEARKKLEINKGRKWGEPDEDGVVEHIDDDGEADG